MPSFFTYTPRDAIPTLPGSGHLAFAALLFFGFHVMPWALWIALALVCSIRIS
ncbi:MAG: hypothetical protein ACREPT_10590 [Rudaea sp.]